MGIVEKFVLGLLVVNFLMFIRFKVFSNFGKIEMIFSMISLNILIILGFLFYDELMTLTKLTKVILGSILIGVIFTFFYINERKK